MHCAFIVVCIINIIDNKTFAIEYFNCNKKNITIVNSKILKF
jgi:hypothetical protein